MGKFGLDEDEEDVLAPKEPQVTSLIPEERKAARTLRIKRRKDALKRAEQPLEDAIQEESAGLIEQATAVAAEDLQRLSLDGAAKVTNVKVTTDEREVVRRALFAKNMKNSVERMETEAIVAQDQYDAITVNWDSMLKIKDPLEIDASMREQKEICDELIGQKNVLIEQLKMDLKRMDIAYYEDLEKQDRDIKELSERIEKQVTIMQRAYEKQLFLIEQAINMERANMLDHNTKRWEALYRQRDKDELAHMDYKYDQLEENKQDMEAIMWDHHEKYREAKIGLESLIQELQRELEKLKAVCIINCEKIGYNYQVLKKREEENVFVRSQQKRKLNKMSDAANTLRAKIRKAAEDGAAEEIHADHEIVKLIEAMGDLEKKSDHFSQVNNYKFTQVWRMSAAKCAELVRDLRHGEIAIHAHILSEPPPPPPPPPPRSPLRSQPPGGEDASAKKAIDGKEESTEDKNDNEAKERLVRHILQLVSDNTGFLVEDRLLVLIEKHQKSSQNLCTLDSIFMALEIQAEEDIELLCKTFLQYAFCQTCFNMDVNADDMDNEISQDSNRPSVIDTERSKGPKGRASRSISASTSRSMAHVGFRGQELSPSDHMLISEADEIIQMCGDPQGLMSLPGASEGSVTVSGRKGGKGVTLASKPDLTAPRVTNPFLCPVGHELEIEPMQVLTALGEFVSVFMPPEKQRLQDILDDVKPRDFTTPSRRLKAEEIDLYWNQWMQMFPAEKDRFWDGLNTGLNNYLNILQERERLHDDVVQLRRRNVALRRLVRGALPELGPAALPHYARPVPKNPISTMPDNAPGPRSRLPPI